VKLLTGIPVSPGVGTGRAALLLQHPLVLRHAVTEAQLPREIARIEQARELSRTQLSDIWTRVTESAGGEMAQLFEAQLLMLDDRLLVPRARDLVRRDRVNAEWALQRAFDEICALFLTVGDDYLRERRGDVADVVGRLRRNLHPGGTRRDVLEDLEPDSVLVADDLLPSQAWQLGRRRVAGLIIEAGSRTHHSAILARALGIPAVAGVAMATSAIAPGDLILLDGGTGELLIEPPDATVQEAVARDRSARESAGAAIMTAPEPARTADGRPIRLEANIELPAEVDAVLAAGAEGIGLFRSEFMLGGDAAALRDEERQYAWYRELVERMAPLPVTVRTFDVDESHSALPDGERRLAGGRDALGMRALRLSLANPDLFAIQLRALVRAARIGPLRILLPFVTSVDELREARHLLDHVREEVRAVDGYDPDIPVGAMIEVPSAALTADLLAEEADFFSVGTNDLVQYSLAVDRTDGRMAHLYEPLHPAMLRLLRFVVRAGHRRRKPVTVCGEMAAEASSLALLVGMGVTSFSITPTAFPAARRELARLTCADTRRLAQEALRLRTGQEVAELVNTFLNDQLVGPGPGPGGEGERR
jgi:phosphoenolpyruvate-protein phosphotransferase (PTS system enzyme I)